jgi:hypothetical protein
MADRKRRTREHIISDLSINYVQRLALDSGYVLRRSTMSLMRDKKAAVFKQTVEVRHA